MAKKPRIGTDPLSWIKDSREEEEAGETVRQQTIKTVKQQTSKTTHEESGKRIKTTYYIKHESIKKLKHLGVEEERDLSDLVNEAIENLHNKYKQ